MSNYNNEDWFNDSVKWYVTYGDASDILTSEFPLFTEIYTVFDGSDYDDYSGFQRFNSLPVSAYSVERPSVDTLVLTCRYVPGTPAVQSLALFTTINDSLYLIAKIKRGASSTSITNGVDRVFKFKLPYKVINNIKVYPNISLRNKRYSNSPIGEEFVTTGEHHHNVEWEDGGRDSIPILPQPSRYVASADFNIQDGFNGTSYVFNESGTKNYNSEFGIASITGKRVHSSDDSDLQDLADVESRIITTVSNVLANIMEEYLMATNSIQILGHAINATATSLDDQNVLFVDDVSASNNRNLKAITSANLRNWLVRKYDYSSASTCTTDACVSVIRSTANVTVVLSKTSQVAFVTNANSGITTSITVTYNTSSTISVYPMETAVIYKNSESTYSAFKFGSTELLKGVLGGTYGFSKVSFASTAGDTTLLDDNLTVSSGKVNSVIKGTLGVTGATTLSGAATLSGGVSGNLSTTGSITAGTGLTVTSGGLTVSGGGITASGQTITAGTLSVTTFSAGNITATKVTVTDGFYISN